MQALIRRGRRGQAGRLPRRAEGALRRGANIEWARTLEQAGVHVVYGVVGLKTHAKICLVVRNEARIRRYAHIGTGNYNPSTRGSTRTSGSSRATPSWARTWSVFNLLTGYSRQQRYRRLLVAPSTLRVTADPVHPRGERGGGRVDRPQAEQPGRRRDDRRALRGLEARRADRPDRARDLLPAPRGAGLSEHIRVRSIVGRYLEHSRIFRFGTARPAAPTLHRFGDLMPRNLDRRVEVTVPVQDPALRERLDEISGRRSRTTSSRGPCGRTGRGRRFPPRWG